MYLQRMLHQSPQIVLVRKEVDVDEDCNQNYNDIYKQRHSPLHRTMLLHCFYSFHQTQKLQTIYYHANIILMSCLSYSAYYCQIKCKSYYI